ncbi:MAG: DoxX family protein [Isosphaeraceae bacterium]|nr:DoxX family protein [Isosphaeraceae bacterium]
MSTNRSTVRKTLGKWLFAALFVVGGVGHFVATDFYMKIIPPYLPFHRSLVLLSGVIEIALGVLLLVPQFSRLAAWGLVALLIAVFPANIYVYQHQALFPLLPLVHALRLPMQGVLIFWALLHTRR